MHRWIKTIVPLLVVSFLFAGCSAVRLNEERDNAIVVGKVQDQVVTKAEFMAAYEQQKAYYGITEEQEADSQYKDQIAQLKDSTLTYLLQEKVKFIKAKDEGMDQLTAEDQTKIDEEIAAQKEYVRSYAESKVKSANDQLMGDALEQAIQAEMTNLMQQSGMDDASIREKATKTVIENKLKEQTLVGVQVSDADVVTRYNTELGKAKSSYTEDAKQFEVDKTDSTAIIYYTPKGVHHVKSILIQLPSEIQSQLSTLRSNSRDTDADTLRDTELEKIATKAQEVYTKATSGEDFSKLMTDYSDDPGKVNYPDGYYVTGEGTSSMVTEYVNAVRALDTAGKISPLVKSDYGYFIIRLEEILAEGDTPFETIKEDVKKLANDDLRASEYQKKLEEWMKDYKVKKYLNRVK